MNAPVLLPSVLKPLTPPEYCDQLANEITLLAGQINAANHRLLKLIAEFDHSKGWSGGGTVRSCAHWLNWKCGIALGAAREKLRVAHCIAELPKIDAAFAAGEISYSKVRAMTRVATPENEDYLLMVAQHGTASHMEQLVGKYQKVQRSMEDEVDQEQQQFRKLVYYQDADGMWIIHAKLPPETGALVVKAIEAVVAPIQAQHQQELQEEQARQAEEKDVSAETFSEQVEHGSQLRFQELLEHTRADALVTITEQFLATTANSESYQGLKGSERCQIMLHVDIDTLRQQETTECCTHEHSHYEEGQWLSRSTARRLSCDASLITVLEDDSGKVLNIGRRSRTVPPNINRALALRDKTCRFPGCCESRYVDAHHIKHWADGGETSLANLVTLCRYHHRQLHVGCFDIRVDSDRVGGADDGLVFTSSSGQEIRASIYPQFEDVSAETCMSDLAPGVNEGTCVTGWAGERCDYGMAVEGLLRRDGSM